MSQLMVLARETLAVVLAVAAAAAVDYQGARRGLDPAGFARGDRLGRGVPAAVRRGLALLLLSVVLFLAVFQPLAMVGGERPTVDMESVSTVQLFLLHWILALALVLWAVLAFAGTVEASAWPQRLRLVAERPLLELGIGILVGMGAWVAVIVLLVVVAALLSALGAEDLFPAEPPAMVLWIAGLPALVRLAVSLSAGVVEEAFFRGFLQPRVGVALSTILFVLAHLTYEQPVMLMGIALLSLVFAALTAWRQSIWAAAAAHATFDGVQLLFLIPLARRLLERPGGL